MVQQNYALCFCSLMTINTSSPSKKYSYVYEFPKSTFRESPILFSVTDYSIIKRTQNKFQNLFTVGSKEQRKEESRPNAGNVSRRTKCSLLTKLASHYHFYMPTIDINIFDTTYK